MEANALAYLLSMPVSTLIEKAKEAGIPVIPVGDTYEIDETSAIKKLSVPPITPGQYINELLCAQNKTWDCILPCLKGGEAHIHKLMSGKLPLSELLILYISRILNVPESEFWKVQRRWNNYKRPFRTPPAKRTLNDYI